MATTKKTPARKTKSVPVNSIVLKDAVLYTVTERRLLRDKLVAVFSTRDRAEAVAAGLDEASGLTVNKYVVDRVELDPDSPILESGLV